VAGELHLIGRVEHAGSLFKTDFLALNLSKCAVEALTVAVAGGFVAHYHDGVAVGDTVQIHQQLVLHRILMPLDKICALPPIKLNMGKNDCVELSVGDNGNILLPKDKTSSVSCETLLPEELSAPIEKGQKLGVLRLYYQKELLKEIDVVAAEDIEAMGLLEIFREILASLMLK